MVSTVPSAWLTMENALARLARDFTILTILTLVLVVVSLLSWFRREVLDLGFVLAIAVLIALRDFDSFCRGAWSGYVSLARWSDRRAREKKAPFDVETFVIPTTATNQL